MSSRTTKAGGNKASVARRHKITYVELRMSRAVEGVGADGDGYIYYITPSDQVREIERSGALVEKVERISPPNCFPSEEVARITYTREE